MTIKRYLYAGLGLLFLGLGAIGVIIPIIPTTPFLLLTSFFFLRSSERLNTWFEGTRMYKRFIANFMETRSLTLRAKILCAAPGVTAMPMLALVVPQCASKAILIGLTVPEIWYFIVRIETVSWWKRPAPAARPASPRRSGDQPPGRFRRRGFPHASATESKGLMRIAFVMDDLSVHSNGTSADGGAPCPRSRRAPLAV